MLILQWNKFVTTSTFYLNTKYILRWFYTLLYEYLVGRRTNNSNIITPKKIENSFSLNYERRQYSQKNSAVERVYRNREDAHSVDREDPKLSSRKRQGIRNQRMVTPSKSSIKHDSKAARCNKYEDLTTNYDSGLK